MTVSFDTLSFAKRLTEAGEKPAVAEAHAMALKEFVMDTIATKADVSGLGEKIEDLREEVRQEFVSIRQEFISVRKEFEERFATKDELRHEIGLLRKDIDAMGLKLTVRVGGMIAVAAGTMVALGKVH
jgi:hypothetical protein